ncbi:SPFH domain-containing protein [Pseudomonas syringae]|uniref:SPFH domain-containing protein n=1 Tax=Pseudomonas syringae TaxID=317 RepID=UPI001F383F8F|nr:SPFH domain-containing protein [Pseudomonas syringae]MCF5371236.1 hypothetical protein [Pseudomonas syringae]MCF5381913.1 hypothetical protein [Pseudomonas syringae]MCF5424037.1 hypothetical protein [Pseudomonas syringae]MCF5454928.1 hypothetical protein [Pseudomonas syringae]MCF5459248.1 hypothetical protein [Pseudomonas syringae]
MVGLTIAAVVVLFVLLTISQGVRIVPQGEEWVVERLGRFKSILKPGLNFIVPYMDVVKYKLPTKDIILEVGQQEIITSDNAVILVNALTFAKVVDPQKAVYGIESYQYAVTSLTMTALRDIVGKMTLDESLAGREQIKVGLRSSMNEQTTDWGISIRTVEIQDIRPSERMVIAMEGQAAAERERKAEVTRAEGERAAAVLQATGRKESATLDAEAQIALADASATAIKAVAEAISSNTASSMYLLGERYITAMEKLAASNNAKVFLLPADIQATVKGLIGGGKP